MKPRCMEMGGYAPWDTGCWTEPRRDRLISSSAASGVPLAYAISFVQSG